MTDPNTMLMVKIREGWGATIAAACASSTVPQAFVAALIANESGGNNLVTRFEPAICGQIMEVFIGLRASLQVTGIANPVGPDDLAPNWKILKTQSFLERVCTLAKSWGLTQIMGWHFVALGMLISNIGIDQLTATLRLMAAAAPHFDLDLSMTDEAAVRDWFTWWNSGSPTGKTSDPNYAENGVDRMLIYAALLNGTAGDDSAAPGPIQ